MTTMKLVLIADVSANGKLLLTENPNHPLPPETIEFYCQQIIQAGNVIMGRKTFDMLQQHFGEIHQILPSVEVVVVSTTALSSRSYTVAANPEKAVNYLQGKGFTQLMIGGGTQVYNEFLNQGLVTDLYFNYIPVIIGDGGLLGSAVDLLSNFELSEHKLLGDNIVQLHLRKR
jgi:dihydrofolate reductase